MSTMTCPTRFFTSTVALDCGMKVKPGNDFRPTSDWTSTEADGGTADLGGGVIDSNLPFFGFAGTNDWAVGLSWLSAAGDPFCCWLVTVAMGRRGARTNFEGEAFSFPTTGVATADPWLTQSAVRLRFEITSGSVPLTVATVGGTATMLAGDDVGRLNRALPNSTSSSSLGGDAVGLMATNLLLIAVGGISPSPLDAC